MNKTVIKLTQFYLAIMGVEAANEDCYIHPQVHHNEYLKLEEKLNDLFFSLDAKGQLSVAFDFYQASITLKKYANLELIMTKEQFVSIAAILFE